MVKWCATRSSYGCVFVTSDVFSSVGWIWQRRDWIYCAMPHYLWQSFSNLSKKQFTLYLLVCTEWSKIVSRWLQLQAHYPCYFLSTTESTNNENGSIKTTPRGKWPENSMPSQSDVFGQCSAGVNLVSNFPTPRSRWTSVVCPKQTSPLCRSLSCNQKSVKDLLLRSLYQIPSEV